MVRARIRVSPGVSGSTGRPRMLAWALVLLLVAHGQTPASGEGARDSGLCVTGFELEKIVSLPDDLGLRAPGALAVDHRDNVVLVDSGNHRVLVVTLEGELVTEFGGHGWGDGQFDWPSDASVYPGFFIYVLDEGNRRVERFDVDGRYVDRMVEEGEAGTPVAMSIGPEGALYLVDADSQTVLHRSQFDEELDPVGRFGSTEGGLVSPRAVAIGPGRELAVADPGRRSVLVFDEFGSPLRVLSLPDTLLADDVVFDDHACVIAADRTRGAVVAFAPGSVRPTAVFDGAGHAFHPSAIALVDGGEKLLALDGETHRLFLIEITHGDSRARR